MLGEKRNASIFETDKPAPQPMQTPVQQEPAGRTLSPAGSLSVQTEMPVNEQPITQRPLPTIPPRVYQSVDPYSNRGLSNSQAGPKAGSLFFKPETEAQSFSEVLQDVQNFISTQHSALITDTSDDRAKDQIKRYITKYVQDRRISVQGLSGSELIDALYSEMAEFGFLTKYIFGSIGGIEEININAWNDIQIQYSDGSVAKLDEHFDNPDHAVNVVRRMLHISGMVLDNSSPIVVGHLSKNIRIAVMKNPVVDVDSGISASIRIVNPMSLKKEDFVDGGTATEDMMDFLSACLRFGTSICIAGATSSGKTTVAGWMLSTVPDTKRIFTIENGSREVDLVRVKDGRVANNVIHTITRPSDDEKQNIDQEMLLDISLRFHPDLIFVGEMRGSEAYTAQEAARTGHAVLSTIHSNSCESTWRRMMSLCKRKYDVGDDTLYEYVTEAFPIVVFTKQLENKERKVMEIMECEILPSGKRKFNTLYRYNITENKYEDGEFIITGTHERVSLPSKSLQKRLVENGMPRHELDAMFKAASAT